MMSAFTSHHVQQWQSKSGCSETVHGDVDWVTLGWVGITAMRKLESQTVSRLAFGIWAFGIGGC